MPETPIPPAFLERMARLLGSEFPAFAAALEGEPVHGLRVNTLKLSPEQFKGISPVPLGESVPWCPSAFILPPSAFSPGLHPYHLAGLYYLQDPSAMAPAELLMGRPFVYGRQETPASAQGLRVLDLAAAPGGKTTHLASIMKGRGLLVANEIKDKRLGHLAVNVERWGAGNVVIANETPERLADTFGAFFDRVLVDAPCSGEGMFRKDMGARADWSPEMVAGCAVRQRNILRVAANLVRPGGLLLYSTCTFAPEEDENVVNGLLNGQADGNGRGEFEVVALPKSDGVMAGRPEWIEENNKQNGRDSLSGAVRLFPHRVPGEGHFACLLRKVGGEERGGRGKGSDRLMDLSGPQARLWDGFAGEVLAAGFDSTRLRVRGERLYLVPEEMPDFGNLRVAHPGVWLGTFKKERFEPAHPLALYLRPGQALRTLDLSADDGGSQAGRLGGRRPPLPAYLAGETVPSEGPSGWTLVTVDGWPLGWGKRVQGIVKNHFPRGWQVYS